MTAFLPPNLLALFAPRDPIPYLEPATKLPHETKRCPIQGVAQYVQLFEDPKDAPPKPVIESREQRMERKRKEKQELQAYKIEQGIALWNPNENGRATEDPYRSLFVAGINYETSESKLRKEFEQFGPIKKIFMAHDIKTRKPRGYAFIEYERERDMHSAYKRADGMKIDGKRVLVDVERGRTVKGWLPRRFGGGVGTGRKARSPGHGAGQHRHSASAHRTFGHGEFNDRQYGGGGGGGEAPRGRTYRPSDGGDRKRERSPKRESRDESKTSRHRSRSKERGSGDVKRSRHDDRRGVKMETNGGGAEE